MALPGVNLNVLDGNLGLISGNPSQSALLLGCCTAGTANTFYSLGDISTVNSSLGSGELAELATHVLSVSGGPVYAMPLSPSSRGGLSSVTHVGPGAGSLAVSSAPHAAITVTCTTGGTLGTAAFTFQIGSGAPSQPVTSAAGWSSSGYQVPGTYVTIVFTAGTYAAGGSADIYTISTLGVVAHPQGSGPAVPTFTASPIDDYSVKAVITTGGANGTMQFTYSLDATDGNTSSVIVSSGGGTYAIPNTGIVLTFSGTQTAADYFTFTAAGPSYAGGDLTAALTALQSTYLSSVANVSLIYVCGNATSAAAAATQAATLETAALALFNLGIYVRFLSECPTVGSIWGSAGSVVVDSADTDSVCASAFASTNAPHVAVSAGDVSLTSSVSGLAQRRSCGWPIIARACKFEASANIGAVENGAISSVGAIYRDEFATPLLDAARFNTVRTFPGLPGFYITDGHTMALSTSDYSPLADARVIDRACQVTYKSALPLVNKKLETSRKIAGAISERAAQKIDSRLTSALNTSLVDTSPQDAVAAAAVVNRTHNILADSKLLITVGVQPFAYSKYVQVDIGLVAKI